MRSAAGTREMTLENDGVGRSSLATRAKSRSDATLHFNRHTGH